MTDDRYHTIEELILHIPDPNGSACRKFLETTPILLREARGSSHNHQAWEGGYLDHVSEVMNIAIELYMCMNQLRELPFALSEALLVLFLHDAEKPWKYVKNDDGEWERNAMFLSKKNDHSHRGWVVAEYGFELTPMQWNALRYVEGEFEDYRSDQRVMNELAAFCHMCDVASARIWHDRGEEREW